MEKNKPPLACIYCKGLELTQQRDKQKRVLFTCLNASCGRKFTENALKEHDRPQPR